MQEYTVQQAAEKALAWCQRHPAWIRICDLPDGWLEGRKSPPPSAHVTGRGDVCGKIRDVPCGHNSMMVFRVGRKLRKDLYSANPR